MKGAVMKAEELAAGNKNAYVLQQFENPANPKVHFETTGPEIWEDTDGEVAVFVAGIGTGGTITGVGSYLKSQNSDVRIVAVEPADSPILTQGKAGPHKIQGLGANFVPDVLDREVYDDVYDVEVDDAVRVARELGTKEGILGGISAGANVFAALEEAKKEENRDKLIVTVICDFGERYISTVLYEDIRG
jgi:cysteine synthase A